MLPRMTINPNSAVATVTPISTLRWAGPPSWDCPSLMIVSTRPMVSPAGRARRRNGKRSLSVSSGEEARALHQLAVTLLFLVDPLGVVVAGHEGLVEGAVVHELLPLGRFAHLLHEIDVVVNLLLGGAWRHEDAAQHQVLDVEAGRLAGRDVAPRLVAGDLVGDRQVLRVEHAERTQLAGAPLRHRLDRIVDSRVDVAADQLHRDLAAALERDVGHLHVRALLDRDRDDLVLLLRSRPAH